jgi:heavy metal sensor kinase
MPRVRELRRLTRGLRFRLTATYAIFFTLLLVGVTALLRARLAVTINDQARVVLDQEWATMKGYVRIEVNPRDKHPEVIWYYDREDNEESRSALNIKRLYLIADSRGHIMRDYVTQTPTVSAAFADLAETAEEMQAKVSQALAGSRPNAEPREFWAVRKNRRGEQFLVRSGLVFEDPPRQRANVKQEHRTAFYVALASPMRNYDSILRRFTWLFAAVIPGALIIGSALGWVVSGRALSPVRAVAQTAQRISGSNLNLRIPTRDAGDELDYLILTFNRMIERLDASFSQIRQFSTDVSHELRTPITAIRGQLEVALFTAQTTEQYREAIINALQDIDRLSQIVRALLLLSQAESGQVVLQRASLDLSDVVRDIVEQFQIPAEAAAVQLSADLPETCTAEVDRVQIERLLTNLLSNAIKFTPANGSVKVRLTKCEPEGGVELAVEDTGPGISPDHLPHIFDRFYRVQSAGMAPGPDQGLGLGLSFVAWIAKAHGGGVRVESDLGRGTRFYVNLPLSAPNRA